LQLLRHAVLQNQSDVRNHRRHVIDSDAFERRQPPDLLNFVVAVLYEEANDLLAKDAVSVDLEHVVLVHRHHGLPVKSAQFLLQLFVRKRSDVKIFNVVFIPEFCVINNYCFLALSWLRLP